MPLTPPKGVNPALLLALSGGIAAFHYTTHRKDMPPDKGDTPPVEVSTPPVKIAIPPYN